MRLSVWEPHRMRLIGKVCTWAIERAEVTESIAPRLVSLKGADMGRMLAAGGLSVVLSSRCRVFAGDEPPPLPPPAVEGPVSDAPGELPPVVEANSAPASTTSRPAAPESRPVLVVPGVTAPGGSRPRRAPAPLPAATTA